MVEEAKKKAALANVPATFMVGDAERLEVPDASFDLVICNSVYHWFPDRQRAVSEIARVLRPNGQALINCVAAPGFAEFIRAVDQVWTRLRRTRGVGAASAHPGKLMGHLAAAGLALEHLEYEVDPSPVLDVGGFLRTMTVVAPTWLAGVPAGGAKSMMTAIAEALRADACRALRRHLGGRRHRLAQAVHPRPALALEVRTRGSRPSRIEKPPSGRFTPGLNASAQLATR